MAEVVPPIPERRVKVNPEPLAFKPIPECRKCRMRAPWCKCGAMDYAVHEAEEPDEQ